MKRLLILPVLLATALPLPAESTMRRAVRDKLPAYSAEEHDRAAVEAAALAAARATAKAAADADPELVVLAPFTVQERALQRMAEDSLYQKGAYDKELVKRELSTFDRCFLNRYTLALPLPGGIAIGGGMTQAQRAREAYLERKNRLYKERINGLARLVAGVDPAEARALRRDLRNEPTTGRPIVFDPRPINQR